MKTITRSLLLLSLAALSFTGCSSEISVENPLNSTGQWTSFLSGNLIVRYPGKAPLDVFQAARKGVDDYGASRISEELPEHNPGDEPAYKIHARNKEGTKIFITVSEAQDENTKEKWAQVVVKFGSGDQSESQKIVAAISQKL
jgi:hypothetical protein